MTDYLIQLLAKSLAKTFSRSYEEFLLRICILSIKLRMQRVNYRLAYSSMFTRMIIQFLAKIIQNITIFYNMERKRIFISNIDQPIGYHLVEKLRDDHADLSNYSLIIGSHSNQPHLHESIYRTINFEQNGNLLCKCILESQIVLVDLTKLTKETQYIVKVIEEKAKKGEKVVVVGLSNFMVWNNSKAKIPSIDDADKEAIIEKLTEFKEQNINEYTDLQFVQRIPEANWVPHFQLQKRLYNLNAFSQTKAYIVCAGLIYGKDFPSSQLASIVTAAYNNQNLQCYGKGNNTIPLIYIEDYLTYIENIVNSLPQQRYFVAVEPETSTQLEILEKVKWKTGNSKEIEESALKNISQTEKIMSSNMKLRGSSECSPKKWNYESFSSYMEDNFDQILDHCQIDIMKGLMMMGKEVQKQKLKEQLEKQFNIYTEEDIFPEVEASSRKKIQPQYEEKEEKLLQFIQSKKTQQYIILLQQCQFKPNYFQSHGVKYISRHQSDAQLIYPSEQFYKAFHIPCPKADEQKESSKSEEKSESEKETERYNEVEKNSEKEISESEKDSLREIPVKSISAAAIDQYMLDNVINYLTEAYMMMLKEKEKNLPTFINVLKGLYERQLKAKTEQ